MGKKKKANSKKEKIAPFAKNEKQKKKNPKKNVENKNPTFHQKSEAASAADLLHLFVVHQKDRLVLVGCVAQPLCLERRKEK